MKALLVVLLLFATRFLTAAWFEPVRNGDLGWQRWLGALVLKTHHIPRHLGPETYTASGAAWVPQEWLLGILIALAEPRHQFWVLAVLATICAVGTLFVVGFHALKRGSNPVVTAFCTAAVGIAMLISFGVRAQVLAWPLLALFMYFLEAEGALAYLTIPVAILWSNLHASAMLAPILALAATIGITIEERKWNERASRAALLVPLLGFAICINPFGWDLPIYAFSLFGSPIRDIISEWQPGDVANLWFLIGGCSLLLGACISGIAVPYGRWRDALLFAAVLWLFFGALRNAAVFAIVVAPLVASRVSELIGTKSQRSETAGEQFAGAAVVALAGLASAFIAYKVVVTPAIVNTTLPFNALAALQRTPGHHHLLCGDFAWCGEALGAKNVQVYLDGRCDPYPLPIWRDYKSIALVRGDWQKSLTRSRADAILVHADDPLAQALASSPQWKRSYVDKTFTLYLRNQQQG